MAGITADQYIGRIARRFIVCITPRPTATMATMPQPTVTTGLPIEPRIMGVATPHTATAAHIVRRIMVATRAIPACTLVSAWAETVTTPRITGITAIAGIAGKLTVFSQAGNRACLLVPQCNPAVLTKA